MVTWAAQNLSESEIADFNAVTNTNNPAAIRFAVSSLNARWKEGSGYEAELVTGRKAAETGARFRSHAELSRAIADPRYSDRPCLSSGCGGQAGSVYRSALIVVRSPHTGRDTQGWNAHGIIFYDHDSSHLSRRQVHQGPVTLGPLSASQCPPEATNIGTSGCISEERFKEAPVPESGGAW